MLNKNIINYFNSNFGVDVTKVDIVEYEFNDPNALGEFIPETQTIRVADLNDELTIVHELTHYCQLIHDASLSIDYAGYETISEYQEHAYAEEKRIIDEYQDELEPEYNELFNSTDDLIEKMLIKGEFIERMEQCVYFVYTERGTEVDARISMCAYFYELNNYVSDELIEILFCCGFTEETIAAVERTTHPVKNELMTFINENLEEERA